MNDEATTSNDQQQHQPQLRRPGTGQPKIMGGIKIKRIPVVKNDGEDPILALLRQEAEEQAALSKIEAIKSQDNNTKQIVEEAKISNKEETP